METYIFEVEKQLKALSSRVTEALKVSEFLMAALNALSKRVGDLELKVGVV